MRRLTVSAFIVIIAVSLCCHDASGKPIDVDDASVSVYNRGRRLLDETKTTTYFQDASTPNLVEKCPLTSDSRPPPRKFKEIRWLHVPKTGSSFGYAIVHYICPGIPDNAHDGPPSIAPLLTLSNTWLHPQYCDPTIKTTVYSGHEALEPEYIENPEEAVVGIFRDPRRRNYSGWLVHGARGEKKHPWDVIEYTRLMRACQGRMLLGIDCNAAAYKTTNYFQPTPEQRVQALKTLSRMAFVGLTEYWHETICLFHAMFGGRITPHEMDNVRPGVAASYAVGRPDDMPIWMKEIPIEEDPFDFEIFLVAKRIFVTNLIKYGIRVPQDLL